MDLLRAAVTIGVNDQASDKVESISSKIKSTVADAGSSSGSSLESGVSSGIDKTTFKMSAFGATIGTLLSTGVTKAASAVAGSIDSAISRVDTLNQFPKVMQQMGFSSDEASASIDALVAGIDGLPTTLDGIAANTQSIALLTGDLDGATNTAIALNDAFLASGSSSADAERGLTQYVQMLSKGSVDLESWRTLQETMGYALRETAAAFGFAGESATNDLYAALQSGEVTFDEFNAKLIELDQTQGGFAETAQTASAGIGTSMENAQSAVTRNLANIIEAINGSGAISGFFDGLKNVINDVGTALTPVAEALGNALVVLEENFNVIAPVLEVITASFIAFRTAMAITETIQGVQEALTAFKTAQEAATIAQAALNAVMNANPFVLIATLIAGVVTALVLLYNNNEDFRNSVNGLFESLGNFLGDVGNGVVTFFTETLPGAFNDAGEAVNSLFTNISGFFAGIGEFFGGIGDTVKGAWDSVVSFVSGIPDSVASFIGGIGDTIWNFLTELPRNLGYALGQVVGNIAKIPGEIWNWLTQSINDAGNWAASLGEKATQAGSGFLANVGNFIMNLPGNIWNWLTETISNVGNWALSMGSKAQEAGSSFINSVGSFIMNLPGNIWSWLSQTLTSVGNWAGDMRSKAAEAGTSFLNGLVNEIKKIPDRVYTIGKNIVIGIYNGIVEKWNWLVSTVQDFAGGFIDGFKSAFGIASPSKVMKEMFGYVMEGAGLGITENTDEVVGAMENSVDAVKNAAVFDATVTADGSKSGAVASKINDWVFNVTINASGSNAVSAGKSIAETLYTELQRKERAFA